MFSSFYPVFATKQWKYILKADAKDDYLKFVYNILEMLKRFSIFFIFHYFPHLLKIRMQIEILFALYDHTEKLYNYNKLYSYIMLSIFFFPLKLEWWKFRMI